MGSWQRKKNGIILSALVAMVTLAATEARYRSTGGIFPACYINFEDSDNFDYTWCSHPFYTKCRYGVCCGPDHYCCDTYNCCRRSWWTSYEAVGIITSSFSWAFLLATATIIIVPRCHRFIQAKMPTRFYFKQTHETGKSTVSGSAD